MSTCKAAKSKLSLGNWIAESAQGFRRKLETKRNQKSFSWEIFPDFSRPVSGTLCFMFQLSLTPTSIGITTIMCYSHLLSCPFWKAETMSFFPLWLLYQACHLPHDDQELLWNDKRTTLWPVTYLLISSASSQDSKQNTFILKWLSFSAWLWKSLFYWNSTVLYSLILARILGGYYSES